MQSKRGKEVLDLFGEKIISQILDRYYKWIQIEINDGIKNPTKIHFNDIFVKLNADEKKLLQQYILNHFDSFLFDMLGFFEENTEFRLYFENESERIDLSKESENFKAEPIINGGWIDRFSRYKAWKEESRSNE